MMTSSYPTMRQVSSNTDNITTYLRSSYHMRGNYKTQFFERRLDVAVTSNPCSVQINRSLHINSYSEKSEFYADHKLVWEGVPHFGSGSEEDELNSYLEKSGFYADHKLDTEGVPHFGSDSYSEKSRFYSDNKLGFEGVPHYGSDSKVDGLNSYSVDSGSLENGVPHYGSVSYSDDSGSAENGVPYYGLDSYSGDYGSPVWDSYSGDSGSLDDGW